MMALNKGENMKAHRSNGKTEGMLKIDVGIPMPQLMNGKKYPFADMKVGESFLVENASYRGLQYLKTMAQNKTGFKFCSRKAEGGIRVWRTE